MIVPTSRPPLARPDTDVDVAVVGAGAAGIAAARRCIAAGFRVGIWEARDRVGGRAVTASFGGHPVDLGAHWLHAGRLNPLVRLGRERGEPIRRGPDGSHLIEKGRFLGRAERIGYGSAFERTDEAFAAVARSGRDRSLASVMPPLGRWRAPLSSTMTLISGRPLPEVSAADFPSEEFGDNHFVRGGYGALVSRLAAGLPVALRAPVSRIGWGAEGVTLEGPASRVLARAVIVTVPPTVLAAGTVRFMPELPETMMDAICGLLPGTYEHVVVNWADAPFRGPDRLAKFVSARTSFGMLTRMDDAPFHYLELDHIAALRRQHGGDAGLARLARSLIAEQFGGRALDSFRVLTVTDWVGDPWSRGAWAVVPPGRTGWRDALSRPAGGRLWFAGEANSRRMWGTVGGAWEAGEAAADSVADALGKA